jgi:hypothetical protein
LAADRLADRAVQPAAALKHEPPVPLGRHVDRKPDRIGLPVYARSALEAAGNMAVRRQRDFCARPRRDGAVRVETRFVDREILGTFGPARERGTGALLAALRLGRRVGGKRRNRNPGHRHESNRHRPTPFVPMR